MGILLLRLCVGIALISLDIGGFFGALTDPIGIAPYLIAVAGAIFLIGGLWTPVTGGLITLDQLWIAFSLDSSQRAGQWMHVFLAVLVAGVAMLGPGAWSVDARLFGRKRFEIGDRM